MPNRVLTGLGIALALTGCFQASDDAGDEIAATEESTSDTTEDESTTTTTTDDETTTEDSTDTTTGDDSFEFATDPPDAYVRVDRMGMPALATALITSKDAYNAADPLDDLNADFIPEIANNVAGLHAALDDDLVMLGLIPCSPNDCLLQAGPLGVPDTLKIDLTAQAGFPNGRRLEDPVIDITLAVLMLDLAAMGQTPTLFADLPLNPPSNDAEFLPDFPYLAPPN